MKIWKGDDEWFLEVLIVEMEPPVLPKSKSNFSMVSGEEVRLINSAIKQEYSIVLSSDISKVDSLIIGKGSGVYGSGFFTISKDRIKFTKRTSKEFKQEWSHQINLNKEVNVNIERQLKSTKFSLDNGIDTFSLYTDMIGMSNPILKFFGEGINVKLFEFKHLDYYSDVFVFGDSYVNCSSPNRWPYYVYQFSQGFMFDGYPGGKSIHSYSFLLSAFSIHKPKYLVWCLGMNDRSDFTRVDPQWRYFMEKVMLLCKETNVKLILATVPSVPNRYHGMKNDYIRNSGYPYIDFDKAVSDGQGNWSKGLLSEDDLHPSEKGAKVMAKCFMEYIHACK